MLNIYREARREFLLALNCGGSCRDPLSEFSERLVCGLKGGTLAPSRTQKGYDFTRPNKRQVQVRYLSNPSADWRNEHRVQFAPECDDYAIVFFEDLDLRAVILFPRETLPAVCLKLGKKHGETDRTLQFTKVNFRQILSSPDEFAALGVEVDLPENMLSMASSFPI
jgi:hypothetical protein